MDKLDEAAISWSWLAKAIGLTGNQTPSPVLSAWSKLKDDRNHYTGGIIRIQKWTSDFWIASTYANALGMLAPRWAIDEEIDDWPTFGMSRMANWKSLRLKATNSQAMYEAT